MIEDIEINPQSINSNINISPNISVNNDNIPEPFISNQILFLLIMEKMAISKLKLSP